MNPTPETAFNKKAPHGVSVFVYRGAGQGQTVTCNTVEQLAQLLSEHSLISLEVEALDLPRVDFSFLGRVREKIKQWDVSPTFAIWWIGSESIRLLKAEELVDFLLGFNDVTILAEDA